MSPSHRLQFCPNYCSVGLSHGLHSFRSSLSQCGFPIGSQLLPENLLRCVLLSSQGPSTWQEPAPAQTSPWGCSFLWAPLCAPLWASTACSATAFLTMVFTTSFSENSALAPNTSLFFSDFGNSRALRHSHSSLLWPQLFLHNNFFLLFNILSQRLMMGMVSAINETVLDLSGICSIRYGRSFYQLFPEVIPVALLQIHR